MKRLVADKTKLYDGTGPFGNQINELAIGERVNLGNSFTDNGMEWLEVVADDRVAGYIKGDTPLVNPDKYCYLNQNFTNVYVSPDTNSQVIKQYKKDDEFYIIDVSNSNGKKWYKVIDLNSCIGYVEGDIYLLTSEVDGQIMVLNEDYVSVYSEPSLDSTIIAKKMSGIDIKLKRLVKDSNSNRWFEVDIDGLGYIMGNVKLLSKQELKEWQEQLKEEYKDRIEAEAYDKGYPFFLKIIPVTKWLFNKGMIGGTALILIGCLLLYIKAIYSLQILIAAIIMIFIGVIAFIRHLILAFLHRGKEV